jgi:hypothetical protein
VRTAAVREPPHVIGDSKQRVPPAGCRLCRNPLVWTGVGAVVIGGIIAVVVASGSKPSPILTVDGAAFGR